MAAAALQHHGSPPALVLYAPSRAGSKLAVKPVSYQP